MADEADRKKKEAEEAQSKIEATRKAEHEKYLEWNRHQNFLNRVGL